MKYFILVLFSALIAQAEPTPNHLLPQECPECGLNLEQLKLEATRLMMEQRRLGGILGVTIYDSNLTDVQKEEMSSNLRNFFINQSHIHRMEIRIRELESNPSGHQPRSSSKKKLPVRTPASK